MTALTLPWAHPDSYARKVQMPARIKGGWITPRFTGSGTYATSHLSTGLGFVEWGAGTYRLYAYRACVAPRAGQLTAIVDPVVSQLPGAVVCDACVLLHDDFVVYRYFDRNGELLYVGATGNQLARMLVHRQQSWWPEVASFRIERFSTRRGALLAESACIRTERPRFNQRISLRAIA